MLIVLAKKDWANRVYDGSLVMGNLMLAAHELGIGSCWIHRAKEEFETEWGKSFLRSLGIEEDSAIWHLAPLPVHADELQAMIILPECTYANDCTVVDYPEADQFVIEL